MALPSLPALHFGCVSKNAATTAIGDQLDAIYDALNHLTVTATYDDGSTVPANAKWLVTRFQNTGVTEAVYCEPAATSPLAGKVVLIWAGAAAGTHSNVVMASPDTYTNGYVHLAMYVATAGQTVARTDYSAWDAATPFTGGDFFTGYTRVTNQLVTDVKLVASAEYLALGMYLGSGTGSCCGGGLGIEAPSDSSTDSITDIPGGVYDFWTTGGAGVVNASAWSVAAVTRGWMVHGATAGQTHHYYVDPAISAVRAMQTRISTVAGGGVNAGNATDSTALSGDIQPQVLAFADVSGGASNGRVIGRHRGMFVGPPRKSGAILSAAAVKTFWTLGSNAVSDNAAILLPY